MRYKAEHKTEARANLLQSAGALAKEKGFGTTGVDALMAAAGLTSGAFYSHFKSKAELLKAIVEAELGRTLQLFSGASPKAVKKALGYYLSSQHLDHPANGCMLPALSAEVARADEDTRETFEQQLLQLKDSLRNQVPDDNAAWAVLAQAVGAVILGRAMVSETSRQAMLAAARVQIDKLLSPTTTAPDSATTD